MWHDNQGLIDISSSFIGVTTPVRELIDEIHTRGWDVQKVDVNGDGLYEATIKNPSGETIAKVGPDPNTALAHALVGLMRTETMRYPRTAAWTATWEQERPEIAQAYADAPVYDPKAAGAWKELGEDSQRRAEAIANQIRVEFTHDPYPYKDVNEMADDIRNKQHVTISKSNLSHPLWSSDQALAYRLVHDVLGHAAVGGDWGWHGENGATSAHMPLLSPNAQKALFTEAIGQAAHNSYFRQMAPQKVVFLDDYLTKVQERENAAGHSGTHPSQSLVPTGIPSIEDKTSAMTRTQLLRQAEEFEQQNGSDTSNILHQWPDGWTVRSPQTDSDHSREGTLMGTCVGMPPERGGTGPLPPNSYESLRDPDNLPHATWSTFGPPAALGRHNRPVKPEYANYLEEYGVPIGDPAEEYTKWFQWMQQNGRVPQNTPMPPFVGSAPTQVDPNDGWESGIEPLPDNAYLWQKEPTGLDPLDHAGLRDQAYKLDRGWFGLQDHDGVPDLESHRQAIANAFRSVLLEPRQTPRWAATHYQHIQNVPPGVSDPLRFSDTLEAQREAHNKARGLPEGMARFETAEGVKALSNWVKGLNPKLDDAQVEETAKRELFHMIAEEEAQVTADDSGGQLLPMQITEMVNKALKRRLAVLTKPSVDQKFDFGKDRLFHKSFNAPDPGVYGDFLNSHIRPIAGVGLHIDDLARAAREDVSNHGGKGHHFRAKASDLVPGVGPKEISHAWYRLQPHTSQLAVIGPSVAESLGHSRDKDVSPRDYFKLERQMAAGRDAAGYGHTPLGQFSSGMYDHVNYGHGVHRDLSPFATLNPTPYDQVDWTQYPNLSTRDFGDPYWWKSTEPNRDQVGKDWDQIVATQHPAESIPYRTAGMTLPQEMREWQTLNGEYPSSSQVVHSFPDGSTIQHHPKMRDTWRVGHMMKNCWRGGAKPDHPYGDKSTTSSMGTEALALHDPNGLPRVAFWLKHPSKYESPRAPGYSRYVEEALGKRNMQPEPFESDMLSDWAEQNNYLYDENSEITRHRNMWDHRGLLDNGYATASAPGEDFTPAQTDLTNGQWELPPQAHGVIIPVVAHPETGEEIEGEPNMSLMQHLKNSLGLASTEDVWNQDPVVHKVTRQQ